MATNERRSSRRTRISQIEIPNDGSIINRQVVQDHYEDMQWAAWAAGMFRRTGEHPEDCPNDPALFLYHVALNNPKEFLAKLQAALRQRGEDPNLQLEKSCKRSIEELDTMLSLLDEQE